MSEEFAASGEQAQPPTAEVENQAPEVQQEQVEQTGEQEAPAQPKVVPLAALHEEREKRKELAQQVRLGNERLAQLAEIVKNRLQPAQEAPQIPDLQVDPVGHFKAQNDQLRQQLEAQGKTTQQIQDALRAQHQYEGIKQHVSAQMASYVKEKPDLGDAVGYVQQADIRALMAIGHSPEHAAQIVQRQHDEMVISLLRQGKSVPESIYALAQARGYSPSRQEGGKETLQSLQKGVAAARSLGGGGSAQKLSLAALAEMPAEEFAKVVGDDDAWRKMWG